MPALKLYHLPGACSQARILSDLFWLSAGWHPAVRACRMPVRWTKGDPAPVRERGKLLLDDPLRQLDARLREGVRRGNG